MVCLTVVCSNWLEFVLSRKWNLSQFNILSKSSHCQPQSSGLAVQFASSRSVPTSAEFPQYVAIISANSPNVSTCYWARNNWKSTRLKICDIRTKAHKPIFPPHWWREVPLPLSILCQMCCSSKLIQRVSRMQLSLTRFPLANPRRSF